MDFITIIFYLLAIIIIGSAAVVVFSKNVMHAAFSLLFTFFGVAGIYVLLSADFLAITQVMIYIGGILVLIIFGVMLTNKISGVDIKSGSSGKFQIAITALSVLVLGTALSVTYINVNWFSAQQITSEPTINLIGNELLTNYLLPFEAASVLLLVAIVGAALIARKKS